MAIRRVWGEAIDKREEVGECVVCGSTRYLEMAHIIGREHDEPRTPGAKTLYVIRDRIAILCGPFPSGCHGDYDNKRLDLLPYLTLAEQVQAVRDAGGIDAARRRLCPTEYVETVI